MSGTTHLHTVHADGITGEGVPDPEDNCELEAKGF